METSSIAPATGLPVDHHAATLVGRVWLPAAGGPALVAVHGDGLHDLSSVAATCSQLLELDDPVAAVRGAASLPRVGSVQEILASAVLGPGDGSSRATPWLLAPCDLQAVKASG